jgi:hypothetical protein
VAALLLGGVAGAGPAVAASVAPWYSSDYNAAHSRANTAESTLTPTTVGNLARKGAIAASAQGFDCGPSTSGPVRAVTEVGGYTYSLANNVVTKARTSTRAVVWRRVVGASSGSVYAVGMAYSSGLVIVGGLDCGSASDPNGDLVAVNAATGAVAWDIGFSAGLNDFVVSSGTIVTAGYTLGSGGVVSAWRVSDGSPVWQRQNDGSNQRVAVVGGVVITTAQDANTGAESMQGLSLGTGAVRWTVNGHWGLQAGDLSGSAGHSVFVTTAHGRINEFNPVTGAFVGAYPTTARNVLAVDASRVYATCATRTISAGVCGYSRATRAQVWIKADASTLAAVGGAVLYLADGTVRNSATGALLRSLWTGTATHLAEADSFVLASLSASNTKVQVYGL